MRMRTMAVAALGAAALTIGGSAAAYASTPAPPPGPKDTIKVFTCKDGKISVGEARLADAAAPGAVLTFADGVAPTGEAGERLHVTQAVPSEMARLEAVPAQPLPDGGATGLVITRAYAGEAAPLAELKEGDACSDWATAVPSVPALRALPAK